MMSKRYQIYLYKIILTKQRLITMLLSKSGFTEKIMCTHQANQDEEIQRGK